MLKNYRNYTNLNLTFNSNLIILTGKNAQGKSNILESIFLSCTGRSHRTPRDKELIKWGKELAVVKTRVEKVAATSVIEIMLSTREKKKIKINSTPARRLGELMGHLNSVIFAPEDLNLVKEGPRQRRRFIDMEISQVRPVYFYYLQQYNRVLNHRNNLLKEVSNKPSLRKTLPVWSEKLAEIGGHIIYHRNIFIQNLREISKKIHKKISSGTEELEVSYKSSIPFKSGEISEIQENFLEILNATEEDDIRKGVTGKGCHRDDLLLTINGIEVRKFGSQGQQRSVVLSLKLSELEIMFKETGEYPILLLDDVMSELDRHRKEMLVEYIEKVQTLITSTDLEIIPDFKLKNPEIYEVRNGNAIKVV